MVQKKFENTETQTEENLDNDGFSPSDGEFEIHADIIIERQRVFKLRNQIRRITKDHLIAISEKEERIAELESVISKYEKTSIQFEELENNLKTTKDENQELEDELNKIKIRFSAYQDVGDKMKSLIESQKRKLAIFEEDIKKKNKRLKLNEFEIEKLKNELNESKSELLDLGNDNQEQSQSAYNTLVSKSTATFENKHLVPRHLSTERHEYARKLAFWNFDYGPLEAQISNYHDCNFIGEQ